MAINTQRPKNSVSLPPQNILAEEILIGHLLIDETTAQNIIAIIKPSFLSLEKHKILFLNIVYIYNKHSYVNITHLIHLLWQKKLLKKIGGLQEITTLVQKAQVLLSYSEKSTYLKEYTKIVYQHYIRRTFIQYGYNILQLSYTGKISTKQLHEKSTQYLQYIGKLIELQSNNNLNHLISSFLLKFNVIIEHNTNETIFSGFTELDRITGGFRSGDLIIIAGRPSMGKTSFAINITNNILFKLKLGVYIFSLEMSKKQILDKIISIASKITIENLNTQKIATNRWYNLQNTCKSLMESYLQIDDEGNASISYIKSKTKLINYINKKKPLLSSITFS